MPLTPEQAKLALLMRGIDPDKYVEPGQPMGSNLATVPAASVINKPRVSIGDLLAQGAKARRDDGNVMKGTGPQLAAMGGGSAAALLLGQPENIPGAVLGGMGAKTYGDAAGNTALSAVPFGSLLKKASILKGAGVGLGSGLFAENLKHLVDEHRIATPKEDAVSGGVGAVLGAAGPAASKTLETPVVTKFRQYKDDLAAAEEKIRQHMIDAIPLKQNIVTSKQAVTDANRLNDMAVTSHEAATAKASDAKILANKANDAVTLSQSLAKKDSQQKLLARQAKYAADIESAHAEHMAAKDDAEAAQDTLKAHLDDMNTKAKADADARAQLKKEQAALLRDQATEQSNAIVRARNGKQVATGTRTDGKFTKIGETYPITPAKIPEKIEAATINRNDLNAAARNAAGGFGKYDLGEPFAHSPEDIAKRDELQSSYASALDNINEIEQRLSGLKVGKAQHREAVLSSTPPSVTDSGLLDAQDKFNQASEDAANKARDAKRSKFETKQALDTAKNDLSDAKNALESHMTNKPILPVEVKPTKWDEISDMLGDNKRVSGAIGTAAGALAEHMGAPAYAVPMVGAGAAYLANRVADSPGTQRASQFVADNLLSHGPQALPATPEIANGTSDVLARLQALLGMSQQQTPIAPPPGQ